MKPELDLSIITLTYNSEATIKVLLDSIKKSPDKLSKEVIVIDNHSQDHSAFLAASHPLKPAVITMPANLGFSKAVNQGIDRAGGKFLLLLNPDTQVIGNALQKLHEFAVKHPEAGAIVPRLLNIDGRPQASVFKFPTITNALKKNFLNCQECFGKYLPDNRVQKVEVAVMAAFLIPRTTLNLIGSLNEKYFLYYEDFDYCRKLKDHRLPLYYLPTAKIKHAHGASGHFIYHLKSPLLASSKLYYGDFYSNILNLILWVGHKWQVILRRQRYRD